MPAADRTVAAAIDTPPEVVVGNNSALEDTEVVGMVLVSAAGTEADHCNSDKEPAVVDSLRLEVGALELYTVTVEGSPGIAVMDLKSGVAEHPVRVAQ